MIPMGVFRASGIRALTRLTLKFMDPVQTTSPLNMPAEVLATLVELSEEINSSLDLDEVLRKTATLVKRLVDYEIFSVMLLDESTQRLYHRFTIGYGEQASKDWQIPVGQGITGTAAATGRAVRVPDVREDPRYINIIDSVRSELVVPLIVKGQSIGVLDIQSTQVDYFTRDQQSIMTLMASRLAIAIENARLFERVRSQADTLLVLNEVGARSQFHSRRRGIAAPRRGTGQARDRLSDSGHFALRRGDQYVPPSPGREIWPERAGETARHRQRRHRRRGGFHRPAHSRSGRYPRSRATSWSIRRRDPNWPFP